MLEFATKLYTAGPWFCLEDVRCIGPLTLASVGDGSYQALYGALWRLTWDRKRGLILQQKQGDVFVEVAPDAPLPELPKQARHISLAFDQAARPVLAYELDQTIFVRQWDALSVGYVYRTVAGLDPVLLMDAHSHFFVPDSDVLLYCLDLERLHLQISHQRNNYLDLTPLATLSAPTYLDQAVSYPLYVRLAAHDARGNKIRFVSPLYPYRVVDAVSVFGGPSAGAWDTISSNWTGADALTVSGGPAAGAWDTTDSVLIASDALSISGGPAAGAWDGLLIVLIASDALSISGGPAAGAFVDAGLPYGPVTDSITISGGPVNGTWT